MFARFKQGDKKLTLNVNHIMSFVPDESGEGTEIVLSNGASVSVTDSYRSVGGYVKKAAAGSTASDTTED